MDDRRHYYGHIPHYGGGAPRCPQLYYDGFTSYHSTMSTAAHSSGSQRHSSRIPPQHGGAPSYALQPPANGRSYTAFEVIGLSIDHGKASTINQIAAGPYFPKSSALYNFFPLRDQFFSDQTIIKLLEDYGPYNSGRWTARVDQIARADHGPNRAYICSLFGGVPRSELNSSLPCKWVCLEVEGDENCTPRARPRSRMRRSLSASGLQALVRTSDDRVPPPKGLRRSFSSNRLQPELQPLDTHDDSVESSSGGQTTEILTRAKDSRRTRAVLGDITNKGERGPARASREKKKQQTIERASRLLDSSGHIEGGAIEKILKRSPHLPLSKQERELQNLLNNASRVRTRFEDYRQERRDTENDCADREGTEPNQKRSRAAPLEAQPEKEDETRRREKVRCVAFGQMCVERFTRST